MCWKWPRYNIRPCYSIWIWCKGPIALHNLLLPSLLALWPYLLLSPSFIPLVFLLFLQHYKQAPDLGPWKAVPTKNQINHFLQVFAQMSAFQWGSSSLPYLKLQPALPTFNIILFTYFCIKCLVYWPKLQDHLSPTSVQALLGQRFLAILCTIKFPSTQNGAWQMISTNAYILVI